MSDFRWELQRKRDGLLVDRAHRLWILRRASGPVIEHAGTGKGRAYVAVHAASGTVVGQYGGRAARGWQFDRGLVLELEPDEPPA